MRMGVQKALAWIGVGPLRVQFSADSNPTKPVAQVIYEMSQRIGRVGRSEALSVPAIKRGRDIICALATLPLETIDSFRNVIRTPLLDQIDPNVPDVVTISQTLEDLLFEGKSWWLITDFGADGYPSAARHLDVSQVVVNSPSNGQTPAPLPSGNDPRGEILVDGKPVSIELIIKFESPNPPLLSHGNTIRRAIALEQAAEMYANDPRPLDVLVPADPAGGDPFTDEKAAQAAVDEYTEAKRKRSVIYIPAALKRIDVANPTPADLQLVQLQQQAALACANLIGLDPEDVGVSTTSRTYQNGVDRRQDRLNNVLAPYASAITSRLSMGDVTKRGQKVRFDYDEYLRADPKTRAEVQQIYMAMGVITADEIRAEEGKPALTAQQRRHLSAIKVKATVGTPVPEIEAASNGNR